MLGTPTLLALFAAVMWFAWLGWDHSYYYVDGVAQGPYRAWQVVGCALAVAAATSFAYMRCQQVRSMWVFAASAAAGVAVPWAVDASRDETGTWVVGFILVFVGGSLALAAMLAVADSIADARRSPALALTLCGVATVGVLMFYPVVAVLPFAAGVWVLVRRVLPAHRHV